MTKLTTKQKLFVQEYLVDGNATQAAIRAGYSPKTAFIIGHENIRKPNISDEIQKAQDERSKRTEISADYVLTTIRDTVERCRQAEPVVGREGPTGEWEFDAVNVLKGCELLGRHLKLFTDKTEHTGKGGGPMEHKFTDIPPKPKTIEEWLKMCKAIDDNTMETSARAATQGSSKPG